jgi:hypothetical protein
MEDIKQYEAWDHDCHREHHCGQHRDEGTGRGCRCRERQTLRQDVRPLCRTPGEDGACHRDDGEHSRAAVSLPHQEHKAAHPAQNAEDNQRQRPGRETLEQIGRVSAEYEDADQPRMATTAPATRARRRK